MARARIGLAPCLLLLRPLDVAAASTVWKADSVCRIDSTAFVAVLQASYTLFGKRLATEPIGAVVTPDPVRGDQARHEATASRSIEFWSRALQESSIDCEEALAMQLICADLERQMGMFDDCLERLRAMEIPEDRVDVVGLVHRYEIELAEQKDRELHEVPSAEDSPADD